MEASGRPETALVHSHVFLGARHRRAERRSWAVIWLCLGTMILEVAGGVRFGSVALVADGLHMSTHAAVLFMAAMAYRFARQHAADSRFSWGTGKIGDLAGFAGGMVLAVIALLIAWDSLARFFAPVEIRFGEAIGLAGFGLLVNIACIWLLRDGHTHGDGRATARDNNLRAIVMHIFGDAAVSVLVIGGLLASRAFAAPWLDPAAGLASATMVLLLALVLVRDTGAILLDMNPDPTLAARIAGLVEGAGDTLADLHVWRLGPGHLGAVLGVRTRSGRPAAHYHALLSPLGGISHLTVEVRGEESVLFSSKEPKNF